nr:ribonuclease H-like domain-containing protein [Tanacetum cinerariifolium]
MALDTSCEEIDIKGKELFKKYVSNADVEISLGRLAREATGDTRAKHLLEKIMTKVGNKIQAQNEEDFVVTERGAGIDDELSLKLERFKVKTEAVTSSDLTSLIDEWLTLDSIALTWIFTTLSKTLQQRLVIENPKMTKEAWNILELIFNDNKWLQDKYQHVSDIIMHQDPFSDLKTMRSMLNIVDMCLKLRAQASYVDSTSSTLMVFLANFDTNTWSSTPSMDKGVVKLRVEVLRRPHQSHSPPWSPHYQAQSFNPSGQLGLLGQQPCQPSHLGLMGQPVRMYYQMGQNLVQPGQLGLLGQTGHSGQLSGQQGPHCQTTGHETNLPNAFHAMTLQDPTIGNWNIDISASFQLNDSVSSLSDIFNMSIYPSVLFVRDNYCTVEFDALGFSVKDFLTRQVFLRCDGIGDLYHVTKPATVPDAYVTSQYT